MASANFYMYCFNSELFLTNVETFAVLLWDWAVTMEFSCFLYIFQVAYHDIREQNHSYVALMKVYSNQTLTLSQYFWWPHKENAQLNYPL